MFILIRPIEHHVLCLWLGSVWRFL